MGVGACRVCGLTFSCALRAHGFNLGCSAPDPGLLFFVRAKKSNQKKALPPMPLLPSAPRLWDPRCPTRLLSRGTVAHVLWAPLRAFSQSLSVLRRGIGGGKTKYAAWRWYLSLILTFNPPGSSRASREDDVGPEGASEGSRACASATGCRVGAPPEASGERGNRRSRRRPQGRPFLSSISFGRHKRNRPGVRGTESPPVAVYSAPEGRTRTLRCSSNK